MILIQFIRNCKYISRTCFDYKYIYIYSSTYSSDGCDLYIDNSISNMHVLVSSQEFWFLGLLIVHIVFGLVIIHLKKASIIELEKKDDAITNLIIKIMESSSVLPVTDPIHLHQNMCAWTCIIVRIISINVLDHISASIVTPESNDMIEVPFSLYFRSMFASKLMTKNGEVVLKSGEWMIN